MELSPERVMCAHALVGMLLRRAWAEGYIASGSERECREVLDELVQSWLESRKSGGPDAGPSALLNQWEREMQERVAAARRTARLREGQN